MALSEVETETSEGEDFGDFRGLLGGVPSSDELEDSFPLAGVFVLVFVVLAGVLDARLDGVLVGLDGVVEAVLARVLPGVLVVDLDGVLAGVLDVFLGVLVGTLKGVLAGVRGAGARGCLNSESSDILGNFFFGDLRDVDSSVL